MVEASGSYTPLRRECSLAKHFAPPTDDLKKLRLLIDKRLSCPVQEERG